MATCHLVRLFTGRDTSCISESIRRDGNSFAVLFIVVCRNAAMKRVYISGHAFWKTLRNAAGFRR